jgi:hypothetical protein
LQPGHGLWLVTRIADQVGFVPGRACSEVTVTFALPGAGGGRGGYLPAGIDRAGTGGVGR